MSYETGGDYVRGSTYAPLLVRASRFDAVAATTRVMRPDADVAATNAAAGQGAFYLDPANLALPPGRSAYLRLVFWLLANSTAPTSTFTAGLYPVSAPTGAAATVSITLGAVVSGSPPTAIAAPAAGSSNYQAGSDFAFPTAGFYAVCIVVTGAMAANSSVAVGVALQRRSA